jgi:predicted transcriptional regulator
VRVLHAVREKPAPVSELAATLKRDRKAVKRDVSLLESFGLVNSREEINPGHGRRRIIVPRAARYQLVATI